MLYPELQTCSNFLRVKFKVFKPYLKYGFLNSNIYKFKFLNRPFIDLFLFPTDQYMALISWLIL